MAELRLNSGEFNAIARAAAIKEARAGTRQVVNRAKVLAPVRFGFLRGSIRPREDLGGSEIRIDVVAYVSYAYDVHEGTPPHVIRPTGGRKFLKFEVGGRTVFAREVHHPGTDARPYLSRALREVASARGWRFVNHGAL